MVVEFVRLLVTLASTAAGQAVGVALGESGSSALVAPEMAPVVGAVLGAGIGYVLGGVVGRATARMIDEAPSWFGAMSAAQLLAGGFGVVVGVGAVVAVPLVVLLPDPVGWPLGALVVGISGIAGGKVLAVRGADVFSRERRAPTPRGTGGGGAHLVDSSAAVDGRVLPLLRAGVMTGDVWVPAFVVDELQGIADAGDPDRRRRGRRGLEVLEALRTEAGGRFLVLEETVPGVLDVDAKLLTLAERHRAVLVTTDANLARAAELRGIRVLNPHALGEALRPMLAAGDRARVTIAKAGSEPGQGIGYLEDGTMVVVAGAADSIGETLEVEVSNMVRTSLGRMLFARPAS